LHQFDKNSALAWTPSRDHDFCIGDQDSPWTLSSDRTSPIAYRDAVRRCAERAMADLFGWLQSVGLPEYHELFAAQEIDSEVLPELTEHDLECLGIPLGHRKKLLKGISRVALQDTGSDARQPSQLPRVGLSSGAPPERRHVTIVFCDIVGSTELAARLDPEDLHEIIRDYQDACAGAVGRFEGYVIKFLGDGVMACFGYPQAHEDDAERAVRAALCIAETVRRLRLQPDVALEVRIGIESGLVVAGDLSGHRSTDERALVGETPNIASRLQALAQPGAVLIGPGTRRLLGRIFDLNDHGSHRIKGFAQPVPVWQVVREANAESRFAAERPSNSIDLIGRDQELALLLDRWDRANEAKVRSCCCAAGPESENRASPRRCAKGLQTSRII
jgi:class 3 adenylate cyclase